jgi:PAS domain S-box-containing protein
MEIDREGTILYANRTLSGEPVSAILGRSVHDLLPEEERARSRENVEKAFRTGRRVSYEVRDLPLGPSRHSIAIHVCPVGHRDEPRSASVVVEDIGDRSRLQEDIAIRVRIEELLVSLAGEFIRVDPEDLDPAIDAALRRVGEAAGADTGGLFLFSEDRARFFQPNAWPREGSNLGRLGPEGLETASFPWSMRKIFGNEPVFVESPESLPPEAAPERSWLSRIRPRRFLGVPIAHDGIVFGFTAFVFAEPLRLAHSDLLLVLRALGIILTNALARREMVLHASRDKERFRDLVEQSLVGIGVFQGVPPRIVFANPAASEILGYPVEELTGVLAIDASDLIHPDDRSAILERYARRLAGDTVPQHHEFRVLRKDGSVRWIEIFATAVSYLGDPAVQMMFVDRTRTRETAAALQRSEERYRALAESAQDYIFLLDRRMRFVYVNPAAAALFGEKPDAFVDRPMEAFMPPEVAEERRENTLRVFETGEPSHLVNEVRFHAGTLVIDTTLAPVKDAGGNVVSVLGIARNITEQRRLEAERRRSEERYRLLAESADDFIMILGPDLRFQYANRALAEFNGRTPEEMVGERSGDFMPPEAAAVREARIRQVLESGEPARFIG